MKSNTTHKKMKKKHTKLKLLLLCSIFGALLFLQNENTFKEFKNYLTWQKSTLHATIFKTPLPKLDEDSIQNILFTRSRNDDKYRHIYNHQDEYPKQLLAGLCNNEELLDYVYHYPGSDSTKKATVTESEKNETIPLFLQWDERWGYNSYGDGKIGYSGCAPTCVSMVVCGLTKQYEYTPNKVAAYADHHFYYLPGTGTRWTFLTEGAEKFGITGKELCLDKQIITKELAKNHPIICSMAPGDFTTEGHFIILAGVKDEKIIVKDPNSRNNSSLLWDFERLEGQIRNLWVYEAK